MLTKTEVSENLSDPQFFTIVSVPHPPFPPLPSALVAQVEKDMAESKAEAERGAGTDKDKKDKTETKAPTDTEAAASGPGSAAGEVKLCVYTFGAPDSAQPGTLQSMAEAVVSVSAFLELSERDRREQEAQQGRSSVSVWLIDGCCALVLCLLCSRSNACFQPNLRLNSTFAAFHCHSLFMRRRVRPARQRADSRACEEAWNDHRNGCVAKRHRAQGRGGERCALVCVAVFLLRWLRVLLLLPEIFASSADNQSVNFMRLSLSLCRFAVLQRCVSTWRPRRGRPGRRPVRSERKEVRMPCFACISKIDGNFGEIEIDGNFGEILISQSPFTWFPDLPLSSFFVQSAWPRSSVFVARRKHARRPRHRRRRRLRQWLWKSRSVSFFSWLCFGLAVCLGCELWPTNASLSSAPWCRCDCTHDSDCVRDFLFAILIFLSRRGGAPRSLGRAAG